MICKPFPNTSIHASARRIGRGELTGGFRAIVRTVEQSAWLTPYISVFKSDCVFATKSDALAAAGEAAKVAAESGYVPAF